ncbi:hypothetical protein RhiirA5_422929, partial [Rhizophagus irregularis]
VEEENIIVKNVACKGLFEDKYREYVLNSPAEFGGSIRPDIAAKELFPEIVKANLRLKSLGKMRCADLKNYLRTHAIWILDKTTLSVRSKTCENFTTRESSICDECDKLRKNSRLNQATKKQRATGKNIRFIPKWYLEHSLSKLLLIADCKIDLNLKVDLIKVNIHETWWKADGVKEKPEIFCFASHHNGHPALQQRKPHLYSLDWLCPQCNSTPEDLNHLWTCLYVLPDLNPCSTYHNEIVKF